LRSALIGWTGRLGKAVIPCYGRDDVTTLKGTTLVFDDPGTNGLPISDESNIRRVQNCKQLHQQKKMPLPPGLYRADHVGSLLRPAAIQAARSQRASGTLSDPALRKVEDAQITAVVKAEIAAGLRSITDGEFRRAYFHLDFLQQLGGVETRGAITSSNTPQDGWTPPRLVVTGKLAHVKAVQVEDFNFLRDAIAAAAGSAPLPVTPKVCIPSPTMVHFRGGRASIDIDSYPDLDVFFDDLAKVYQTELDALYAAGARFVQLDDTNLAYLCDEKMRDEARARGDDPDELPMKYAVRIGSSLPPSSWFSVRKFGGK
jgi:5-methyltetrahydropteroyltriglutamate--homocysteine methyltransferase